MSSQTRCIYHKQWLALQFELEQCEFSLVNDYVSLSPVVRRSLVARMLVIRKQMRGLVRIAVNAGLVA